MWFLFHCTCHQTSLSWNFAAEIYEEKLIIQYFGFKIASPREKKTKTLEVRQPGRNKVRKESTEKNWDNKAQFSKADKVKLYLFSKQMLTPIGFIRTART